MALVATPRNVLPPRHNINWTHDVSHLPPHQHFMTPSHAQPLRPPLADVPMDVFTASAPARMPIRIKRPREESDAPHPAKRPRDDPTNLKTPPAPRARPKKAQGPPKISDRTEKLKAYQAQEKEFREKYSRAFPTFTFHFDSLEPMAAAALTYRVQSLGARVDTFFSKKVSHVITSRPIPALGKGKPSKPEPLDKENIPPKPSHQQSQNQLQRKGSTRPALANLSRPNGNLLFDDAAPALNDLLMKALHFGMKVWSVEKLNSVLDRILLPPSPAVTLPNLSHLLADERLHGTRERDPNALRPDYTYFPKSSYFVLVEDATGEHCPILIKSYERPARGQRPSWPVLHAHRDAKCPFSPEPEKETSEERPLAEQYQDVAAPIAPVQPQSNPTGAHAFPKLKRPDLRKVLSMNQISKRAMGAAHPACGQDESNDGNASVAEYIAASGNSVNITSAIASTNSLRSGAGATPGMIGGVGGVAANRLLAKHVLTNRAAAAVRAGAGGGGMGGDMPVLRKSKSTNTVRLPMREETKKPGYCENCRLKFADFTTHVKGKKHRAFATRSEHFFQLDEVLERLRRPLRLEYMDIDAQMQQQREMDMEADAISLGTGSEDGSVARERQAREEAEEKFVQELEAAIERDACDGEDDEDEDEEKEEEEL